MTVTNHNITFTDQTPYKDFYDETNQSSFGGDSSYYEQIHIHLDTFTTTNKKISMDNVKIKVHLENDKGDRSAFPLGEMDFESSSSNHDLVARWDKKGMILRKKNDDQSKMIVFQVTTSSDSLFSSKDTTIATFKISRDKLTTEGDSFHEYEEGTQHNEYSLKFRYRIETNRIVSKQDKETFDQLFHTVENVTLNKSTTEDLSNQALLQCFQRDETPSSRAVLWIPGRNDGFMHSHVYNQLFKDATYDLYVLNYRSTPQCLNMGWVKDPNFSSHCKSGNFNDYNEEIEEAIKIIKEKKKIHLLGYAHSTGGPILINYLMEKGDEAFNGFIFNSPFLSFNSFWQEVATNGTSLITGNLTTFIKPRIFQKSIMDSTMTKGGARLPNLSDSHRGTTDAGAGSGSTIYQFRDGDKYKATISPWTSKIYAKYYFETGVRPIYEVPKTRGFITGTERVHAKIQRRLKDKDPITEKPFVFLSSRADDTLTLTEVMGQLIDAVGIARTEIQLQHNAHDIFLSADERDTKAALDFTETWMKLQDFV